MQKQTYVLLAIGPVAAALLVVALVVLLPGAKGAGSKPAQSAGGPTTVPAERKDAGSKPKPASAGGDPVIVAAGDIACDPASHLFAGGAGSGSACHMKATARLVREQDPTAVLTLGDDQYENGELSKFEQSYASSWGAFKSITHPAVGNHEYNDPAGGASGYFHYFGSAAGSPSRGYYSYDVGSWHLIALNSECSNVGGCQFGSPQERWLRKDLASHSNTCTLAYWHEPRWSSGQHGSNPAYSAFWTDLYDAHADVVLVGHDHDYERFAPQNPFGKYDPRGVREFVVGTGGKNHYAIGPPIANSQVRNDDTFGVLRLTLRPTGYDWHFLPEPGKTFTDSGSADCVGAGPNAVKASPRIRGRVLFRDRFESGRLSRWTTVKGLRIERRQVHRGRWAAIARSMHGNPAYALKKLKSPRKGVAAIVWFKLLRQGSSVVDLFKLRTGSGRALLSVYVTPTGVLGYQNNVTTRSTYSQTPVSPRVWHSLEIRMRVAHGRGKVKTWLDGYPASGLTKAQPFGTKPIRLIQLGENVPGRTYAVAFDNLLAAAWGP
jgi:calcineurin-like phosphoesterase family protein